MSSFQKTELSESEIGLDSFKLLDINQKRNLENMKPKFPLKIAKFEEKIRKVCITAGSLTFLL